MSTSSLIEPVLDPVMPITDYETDASYLEALEQDLARCCQACFGRNEPHSCPPRTEADGREPMRHKRLLIWANPERDNLYRVFEIAYVSSPYVKVYHCVPTRVELIDTLEDVELHESLALANDGAKLFRH